jgi:hypothetical protein
MKKLCLPNLEKKLLEYQNVPKNPPALDTTGENTHGTDSPKL